MPRTPEPLADRIERHTRRVGDCIVWTGGLDADGYGKITIPTASGPRTRGAHRVAYELARGDIPEGLELDHLCRNRPCVNHEHLEPVTSLENLLRGDTLAAKNARKTECPRGHPYAGGNLRVTGTRRVCRACARAHARRYRSIVRNIS